MLVERRLRSRTKRRRRAWRRVSAKHGKTDAARKRRRTSHTVEQGGKEGREQNADDGVSLKFWSNDLTTSSCCASCFRQVCVCRVADNGSNFPTFGSFTRNGFEVFSYTLPQFTGGLTSVGELFKPKKATPWS